ncbi:WD40 repeat domain-containing protein [Tautonia sociabilis]|nr:hypothetical protein [Tautonia sociabilis]
MATSATARRDDCSHREIEGQGRARAIARRGGRGFAGPGLIVVVLLLAALAYPLVSDPGPGGSRIELPRGSLVSDVAFAPGGAAVYLDHKLLGPTIVDVEGGRLRMGRSAAGMEIARMAVDPSGRSVAVADAGGSIRLLDPDSLRPIRELLGHQCRVMDMAFSADGSRLLSVDSKGIIRVWDPGSGRVECEFERPDVLVSCAFAPDGTSVAVGGRDGTIEVIPADGSGSDSVRWEAHGPRQIVFDLAYSPDGRTLVSLGLDGSVRLWEGESGWASKREIRFDGKVSLCVAMTSDGRTLATGHIDGSVRLWDATTGAMLQERRVDRLQASSVSFSPDGRRLVVGSGGSVSLIDLSESV